MIVTCDKCKTKYNVKEDLAGKKIRCVRCGNVWKFTNDAFTSFMSEEAHDNFDSLPKKQSSGNINDAFSMPQDDNNEQVNHDVLDELRQELTSELPEAPLPESDKNIFDFGSGTQSQENVDALFDTQPSGMKEEEPKSQQEVDSMFDNNNAGGQENVDLSGINNDVSGNDENKEFKVEAVFDKNSENQASAESIVEQISQNNSENIKMVVSELPHHKKGFSVLKFLLVTIMTMLIFTSVSLWFLRFELAKEIPAVIPYYEKIGIDVLPVGTGFDFKGIIKEKFNENGVDSLLIKGDVVNISERSRKVPSIMLVLFDGNHIMLDTEVYSLRGIVLDAGESRDFTITYKDLPSNAVEAELIFTKERMR